MNKSNRFKRYYFFIGDEEGDFWTNTIDSETYNPKTYLEALKNMAFNIESKDEKFRSKFKYTNRDTIQVFELKGEHDVSMRTEYNNKIRLMRKNKQYKTLAQLINEVEREVNNG